MKLTCEHITKVYSGKEVLRDVSLTLDPGKIYGLIGRNGAGKTTLLSILTGQNPATKGTIALDGEPVWENRKALEKICFSRELSASAQSGISSIKVKEYLRVAASCYPNWDKDMAERLTKLFKMDLKKRICKLSDGQRSMVTILVAMCSKAPFTLLDEPVAGLDVVAREQFYKLLLEEYTQSGRTFLVSTHILEEAAGVLEEVIIIKDGELLTKANTQELLDSARYVSGKIEAVDKATAGLETHHPETIGRSKGVTVFLKPGEDLADTAEISVQPVTLQQVFVALVGEEESHDDK